MIWIFFHPPTDEGKGGKGGNRGSQIPPKKQCLLVLFIMNSGLDENGGHDGWSWVK